VPQVVKTENATIDDMQVRQRDDAALDAKYTKELVSAQAIIDQLTCSPMMNLFDKG